MKTEHRVSSIGNFRWFLSLAGFVFALVLSSRPAAAANFYQGVSPGNVPWPGGIVPYVFDTNTPTSLTPERKAVYLAGLKEWELAANIHFVPRSNETRYVLLKLMLDGSGNGQYIDGNPPTMILHGLARGLMCHECGHLLGFQHEHQRTNRDAFVVVNFTNIVPNASNEFVIDSNSVPYQSYDLESVTHYNRGIFSTGTNLDSIDPLPAYQDYRDRLGNMALSIGDREAAAYLYGATTTPLTNIVTTTTDGGFGSLRAAIYYANDHTNTTIRFNIATNDPGYSNGVYTIYLIGELPPLVTAGTVIDGTTQPGCTGPPLVALDGSQVVYSAGNVSGLHLFGSNCVVRALALNNFPDSGIQLLYPQAQSNRVEGCFIGLVPGETNAAPNALRGVNIAGGAHDNTVGGTNTSQRNMISGNAGEGIQITGTNSDRNRILGNYIGVDSWGEVPVGNGSSGVGTWADARDTFIGGADEDARNVISGNGQYGIYVGDTNTTGVIIQGNYIGTDSDGTSAVANMAAGVGVFSSAHDVTIGGTNAGAGNVISGNGDAGIRFQGSGVKSNSVHGNYIGVDASGMAALPNFTAGIYVLDGASANDIGGVVPAARNILSGNGTAGLYIADPGTSNNLIRGNYIGLNCDATDVVSNGWVGIYILNGASGNVIGGVSPGDANTISGNGSEGINIADFGTMENVVEGNFIGTGPQGTNVFPNGFAGVGIWNGAASNVIGGTIAGAGNIISGNAMYGLALADPGTSSNVIQRNFIGTGPQGTNVFPNGFAGVGIWNGASSNMIGGAAASAGNVISGNAMYGLALGDPGTGGNVVQGNFIGTDRTGTNALGNSSSGAALWGGAVNNIIGGIAPASGNVIAFNGGDGVTIYDDATTSNTIRGNAIFNNAGLAINLVGGMEDSFGVTTNDFDDADSGPNNLQNFPEITKASVAASVTTIDGTLNGATNRSFWIDIYRNDSADPSTNGEGQHYLATANLSTDAGGTGSFSLNAPGDFAGEFLAATATDIGSGDTSEFSIAVLATNGPPPFIHLDASAWISNRFTFSITLETNRSYRVQAATNLTDNPIIWLDLTNFLATNSPVPFTDYWITNVPMRFYRLVTP